MQKIVLVLNKSHKYSLKKKSASSTLIFYAYVAMLVLHWKATKLVTELTIIPWFQTSLSHRSVLVEEVEVYFEEISLKTMIRPFKSLAPNSRQSLSKSPSTTSFWSVSVTSFNGPCFKIKRDKLRPNTMEHHFIFSLIISIGNLISSTPSIPIYVVFFPFYSSQKEDKKGSPVN